MMTRPTKLYCYESSLIRVIDGDTIYLKVDHGFRTYTDRSVRLNRIDAPEIRGKEKVDGQKAKAFVEDVLNNCSQITLQSQKVDSFGRAIGEIWADDQNLSDLLVSEGFATYKAY